MKIVVLLKRVPDTAAKVRVAEDGVRIDPSGVEYVMNPYDEIAVEQAIQFKEADGGSVSVLCLGAKEASKEIRTAMAMGVDTGTLLLDEAPARDAVSTADALAGALEGEEYDLILAGWKAVDTDDGAVAHMLAAKLGIPCVTMAMKIERTDDGLEIHREVEGATEVVRTGLPALVTVQKGLVEPRYTSLKGIMMAKRKKLEEKPGAAADAAVEVVRMAPPPARQEGRIVGEGAEAVPALIEALSDEQKMF